MTVDLGVHGFCSKSMTSCFVIFVFRGWNWSLSPQCSGYRRWTERAPYTPSHLPPYGWSMRSKSGISSFGRLFVDITMTIFSKLKLWSIFRQIRYMSVQKRNVIGQTPWVLSKFHGDMQIYSRDFYTHKSDDTVSGWVRQSFAVSVFALHRANVIETCPELRVA